jgi:hypothetical protein
MTMPTAMDRRLTVTKLIYATLAGFGFGLALWTQVQPGFQPLWDVVAGGALGVGLVPVVVAIAHFIHRENSDVA